jgi:hypothetical protein
VHVDPVERVRLARRRFAEPVELMAQSAARHAAEFAVDAVDMNAVIDQIDLNRVLDHIDVNRVLARVDVNRVLDRVDVNRVLDRVDLDTLLSRVDVNALADRIDIAGLLDKTELSAILTRSSTTVFSEGIDLVRSQAVGLDSFIARWADRLLGRGTKRPAAPLGPPRLLSLRAEQ